MEFRIGQTFHVTCWSTGGSHTYAVKDRKERKLMCSAIYKELDGTHNVESDYGIFSDENEEYIVTQSYLGHESRVYAKDLDPDEEPFNEYEHEHEDAQECEEVYCQSSTNGDYSPSNPWNAPGMNIRDFI